eukprot:1938242-Pleurochrysis_carterae.AAC.5
MKSRARSRAGHLGCHSLIFIACVILMSVLSAPTQHSASQIESKLESFLRSVEFQQMPAEKQEQEAVLAAAQPTAKYLPERRWSSTLLRMKRFPLLCMRCPNACLSDLKACAFSLAEGLLHAWPRAVSGPRSSAASTRRDVDDTYA